MPLAPGDMFAGYRIVRELGGGGMGTVYLARHPRLPRDEALKLLRPELSSDATFAARFRTEADVVARLAHPHIVPVHDRGEDAGQLWLSMSYIDGSDVEDALSDGPLPPQRVAHIVSDVASALDYAHSLGVLHRDVKPANILLSTASAGEPEQVFLTDFGIAKALTESTKLTATGSIVATLDYASPETIESRGLTPSSDLYSLGCVLYKMLTGRIPYPGDSIAAALYGHLTQPPPRPTDVVPVLPREIDQVVARALAKDPADRYPTCRALADAAAAVLTGDIPWEPPGQPPPALRGWHPGARAPKTDPVAVPLPPPGDTVVVRLPAAGGGVPSPGPPPWTPDGERAVGAEEPPYRQPSPTTTWTAPPPPPTLIRLPLRPEFSFVSGPLPLDGVIPLLDHQAAVDELRDRLQYSPGGAILLTGFTGAGKTTVVERALGELRARLCQAAGGPVPLVDVRLNVARPIEPDELLIKLIRNLYEALDRAGAVDQLPPPTRDRLQLAFQRTSQSLKEIKSRGGERGGELGLAGGSAWGAATPSLKLSAKRTFGRSTEFNYLAYTLADAEHDFSSIVEEIARPVAAGPGRPWWAFWRRAVGPWAGRLVVVLDELDKLTADKAGEECLTALLTALKNVFTAAGIHFVFVAGPDVTDLARADSTRGTGIYDAVFIAKPYLPCISPRASRLLVQALSVRETAQMESVCDYLSYRSRGLPRLLLGALSSHVIWRDDYPTLIIEGQQAVVVDFFAALNRKLDMLRPRPITPLTHPIDQDRFRMGAYLVTEWALRRGSKTFTGQDIEDDAAFRPDRRIVPPEMLDEVLHALASGEVGVLERWDADRSSRTLFDVAPSDRTVYRLAEPVMVAATRTGQAPTELGRVGNGTYILLEELGRGALGRTYKAFDQTDGGLVAIKLLDLPELAHNEVARKRLLREAALVERLSHPALVRSRGVLHEDDGTVGLVAEFVDGRPLSKLLAGPPLFASFAVAVGCGLAELLAYLAAQGVARLDLKPSNIVVCEAAQPVVIDLGLATRLGQGGEPRLTAVGTVLGTPRYAAPEQLRGDAVDIRGDLYSLGLILYEVIAGVPARGGKGHQALAQALHDPVDLDRLTCSPQLRSVLSALVEPDPRHRPDDPAAVAAALVATPEGRGGDFY